MNENIKIGDNIIDIKTNKVIGKIINIVHGNKEIHNKPFINYVIDYGNVINCIYVDDEFDGFQFYELVTKRPEIKSEILKGDFIL